MIHYIETHITEACNLKCRGCSHFSVFAKPKHKDIEEFRREFERLHELGEIQIIRLMGGEPLLNPNFMDYLRIARQYFPNSTISLVTNGLLKDRIDQHLDELRALRIDITVSYYHLESQDVSVATQLHDKEMLYNISLDPTGSQDSNIAFLNCDIKQYGWLFFRDGRMYPCCIAGCIHDFWDHFALDWEFSQEDLSIDIFTHTLEEIEAFVRQPCKLCRFCDTKRRARSYRPFEKSSGDIKEWTI